MLRGEIEPPKIKSDTEQENVKGEKAWVDINVDFVRKE
jgi:hypothetical protein